MKKIFYLASIAALALSSCTKDETTEAALQVTNGGIEIVASMESNDTRTELVENEAGGFEIVWNGNDALLVYEDITKADTQYPLKGARFGLKGGADGTATGSFYYRGNGNVDKLSADQDYVAFYPSVKGLDKGVVYNPYLPLTDNVNYYIEGGFDLQSVVMEIPAVQTYEPKSFAAGVVPAISKSFTVNADGTATVAMQPLVDFVMVEAKSTVPITSVNLQLISRDKKGTADATDDTYTVLPIAGDFSLIPYTVDGVNVRYYSSIVNNENAKNYITLETGNLADNTSMKDANTYVFTIPGNILGKNQPIEAIIWFNDDVITPDELEIEYNYKDLQERINKGEVFQHKAAINGNSSNARRILTTNYANKTLENGIFWFNKADAPVEYTSDYFLIKNELDYFQYFSEYGVESTDAFNKNAYVVEGIELDLTTANMKEVLEAAIDNDELDNNDPLAKAIDKYLLKSGKFPTISEYNNVFKGNGASIVDIDRPLASPFGLFGNIDDSGVVNNINLSGLIAATVDEKDHNNFDFNNNGKVDKGVQGYILASKIKGKIDNISVADLTGEAVIGDGTLAHFQEITIGEAGVGEELAHLIASVSVNNNFEIKAAAWSALEELGSVFHTIVPSMNGEKTHHIATLPEGAKYEDFTCTVDYLNQDDVVLSVLAGKNLSYWTGGVLEPVNTAKKWNNNKTLGANGAYDDHAAIMYAEELAGMNNNTEYTGAYLTRNLDLNGSNGVEWTSVNFSEGTELYGNNLTISNLLMPVANDIEEVAPFTNVVELSKVTFDGVDIVIEKDVQTPKYISGLVNSAVEDIYGVTLKNLNINIVDAAQKNDKDNRYVGWFSANPNSGVTVVNSDVINPKSNVVALHGMVGALIVNNANNNELEAIFRNSNVTGASVKEATKLTKIEKFDNDEKNHNLVASHVAVVFVDDNYSLSFSDYDGSKPAFQYYFYKSADNKANITVSYDYDDEVVINKEKGILED